jgi:hypothetical protein
LHEGAEHVGAVDDLGSQQSGEGGDGCEQARGSLLDGAPLVRPGWPLRTRPIAAAGWPPGRAVVEEGAVGGLNLEQAPGRLLACGDPGWVAEMLGSLDTGVITISRSASDPRAAANARGSPGGTAARSPFAGDEEAVTGEQLNCAAQHVERLSRRGVVAGIGAIGAAGQGHPLALSLRPVDELSARSRTVCDGNPASSASVARTSTAAPPLESM